MFNFKALNSSQECYQLLNLFACECLREAVKDINITLILSLIKLPNIGNKNDNQLSCNSTSAEEEVDGYPVFDQRALMTVIVYCWLFVIAAFGNVKSFLKLFRSRLRKSCVSVFITHLTIADALVTLIIIPFEIVSRLIVGGTIACKILLLLRDFVLYLSSNVMICISLDRYVSIIRPLMAFNKRSRGKRMWIGAWIAATWYVSLQLVLFQVKEHPKFINFMQCVSFGYFSTPQRKFAHNMASLIAIYFLPLVIIIGSYTSIYWNMRQKSIEGEEDIPMTSFVTFAPSPKNCTNTRVASALHGSTSEEWRQKDYDRDDILRWINKRRTKRARARTLKMTTLIVVIFLVCRTPYVIMALWYMFDIDSAQRVPAWLQDALFMMVVTNSCMNPIVYDRYGMGLEVTGLRLKHKRWSTPNDNEVLPSRHDNDVQAAD